MKEAWRERTGRHGHRRDCNINHEQGTPCEHDTRPYCGDCGLFGAQTGHMTCEYPQDHGGGR